MKKWDDMSIEEQRSYIEEYTQEKVIKMNQEIYQEAVANKENLEVADLKLLNITIGMFLQTLITLSSEEEDSELLNVMIETINKNIPEGLNKEAILNYCARLKKLKNLKENIFDFHKKQKSFN